MPHEQIYKNLIELIQKNQPETDISLVEKAYKHALAAHGSQLRKSGEPYIIHPLSVAVILAEIGFDLDTIVAGVLHDVIEDTDFTFDDVKREFNETIAILVDGVTKLEEIEFQRAQNAREQELLKQQMTEYSEDRESKIKYAEEQERKREAEEGVLKKKLAKKMEIQAENYRKMFLAMSKDIRVIIIKIADRLHNMRTLKFMRPEKQIEVSQETLDIYAPLAHRLGIAKLRYELEDLSLKFLDKEAYHDLAEKINKKQTERTSYINNIVISLESIVKNAGIDCEVQGRPKHFFSIYKKITNRKIALDQMYDLFAVRVIVDTVLECYSVLGLVHETYTPMMGRFKDYIAMPKPNKYQSLHTTLIGPEGEPFELQIRTKEMHRVSEYGIAAHWKYKGTGGFGDGTSDEEKLNWLRQILEQEKDTSDNSEYLEGIKTDLNVFADYVYCFTPKGEVVSLLRGATPIDFAYAIHSAVGHNMIGARVNGSIVSFDYQLDSGDRIEVITSRNSKGPKPEWLNIVKSGQARSKINQWFRKQNKEENSVKGKELLDLDAKRKGYVFDELLTEERLKQTLNRYNMADKNALFAAVGHGGLKEGFVVNRLIEHSKKEEERELRKSLVNAAIDASVLEELIEIDKSPEKSNKSKKSSGITIQGMGDLSVKFSKCCSPVPGDEIIGFVTRGRGISIHRTDCNNIVMLEGDDRNRTIEAEWNLPEDTKNITYRADLSIICEERMNLLLDISKAFSDSKISVKNMNARSGKNSAIFDVTVEI
ncbi:MAG: RelA/SpoT family protein, partial [Defluviitaleaceae bacterium]|nr:RelA/SpoT family protein [Defluviitaleaceae bacterium]